MLRVDRGLVLLIAGLAAPARPQALLQDLRIDEPRAFGHFIGDVLVRDVTFVVPAPLQLAPQDGLPALGRTGAWTQLIDRRLAVAQAKDGRRYHLVLTYQIVNCPPEPRLVSIAGAQLHLVGGGTQTIDHLPDWSLSLVPLTVSTLRAGLEERRPPRPPRALNVRRPAVLAGLFAAAGFSLAAWFGLDQWGLGVLRPRGGPFARADVRLRRLAREPRATQRGRDALRTLHRAFDETAGRRVFADRVDEELAQLAQFAGMENEIRRFYELSRAEFFGHGAGEISLPALLHLCGQLKSRERSHGGAHVPGV